MKKQEPSNSERLLDGWLHNLAPLGWIQVGLFVWFVSYGYYFAFIHADIKPLYSYLALVWFAVLIGFASTAVKGDLRVPAGRHILHFAIWSFMYIIYFSAQALRLSLIDASIADLISNIEMLVLFWCAVYLMSILPKYAQITAIAAVTAIFGVVLNLWDFLDPLFSTVPGRAAGLYENPNISGKMIALLMIAGVTAVPARLRLWYLLFCGIGVLATFSRSAWLVWAAGAFLWLSKEQWKEGYKWVAGGLFAFLLGMGSLWVIFSGSLGELVVDTPMEQYLTPNTAARLGIGALALSGDAADERKDLAVESLKEWSDAPLIGHGLGYTSIWQMAQRPHNMYLLYLVEGGAVGLVLYLYLMWILWRGSSGPVRILAYQLIISSLFTHNNLEQPAVIMMMAFIVTYGAVYKRTTPQRSQFVYP